MIRRPPRSTQSRSSAASDVHSRHVSLARGSVTNSSHLPSVPAGSPRSATDSVVSDSTVPGSTVPASPGSPFCSSPHPVITATEKRRHTRSTGTASHGLRKATLHRARVYHRLPRGRRGNCPLRSSRCPASCSIHPALCWSPCGTPRTTALNDIHNRNQRRHAILWSYDPPANQEAPCTPHGDSHCRRKGPNGTWSRPHVPVRPFPDVKPLVSPWGEARNPRGTRGKTHLHGTFCRTMVGPKPADRALLFQSQQPEANPRLHAPE